MSVCQKWQRAETMSVHMEQRKTRAMEKRILQMTEKGLDNLFILYIMNIYRKYTKPLCEKDNSGI